MKCHSCFVTVIATVALTTAAMTAPPIRTSGIYLSGADYTEHRLSFEGDCKSKSHKLELHDVTHRTYIHVTHGTGTKRYDKSDLFGFRSCEGVDYRFAGNREYQIVEASAVYIYQTPRQVSQTKGVRTVPEYHFSVGPTGAVTLLTLGNLKRAFPDNHKFHDSLDQMFGTGGDLAQFDDFHKMFKVNRILIASTSTDR